MGKSATAPSTLVAREREARALELRKAGATYAAIGEALGVSESGAFRAVQRVLSRLIRQATETQDELRRIELERLDGMLLALASAVRAGHLGAIDRAIRIQERRARLLGLDAPTRVAPTSPDGSTGWSPTMSVEEAARILHLVPSSDDN